MRFLFSFSVLLVVGGIRIIINAKGKEGKAAGDLTDVHVGFRFDERVAAWWPEAPRWYGDFLGRQMAGRRKRKGRMGRGRRNWVFGTG